MVEVGTAGQMVVGPRNVNDAERSPKPVLTVKECFAHSSNVGMSKLAYKAFGNNPKKFKEYLHRLSSGCKITYRSDRYTQTTDWLHLKKMKAV